MILDANGQDLSYVTIEIIDDQGTICDKKDKELVFEIDGPGELIGIDNGNLKDTNPYKSQSRSTWNGRALAIIKGKRNAGEIKLSVKYNDISNTIVIKNN